MRSDKLWQLILNQYQSGVACWRKDTQWVEQSTNFTLCCSKAQNKTDLGQIPLLPFSSSPLDQRLCSAPSRQRWRFPDALPDDGAELKLFLTTLQLHMKKLLWYTYAYFVLIAHCHLWWRMSERWSWALVATVETRKVTTEIIIIVNPSVNSRIKVHTSHH